MFTVEIISHWPLIPIDFFFLPQEVSSSGEIGTDTNVSCVLFLRLRFILGGFYYTQQSFLGFNLQ